MKIAIFGKTFSDEISEYLQVLMSKLSTNNFNIFIYKPYYLKIKKIISPDLSLKFFNDFNDLPSDTDFLFSIGGDGTLLSTLPIIRDLGIPVIGINMGRLGFLSTISKEEISSCIDKLINKKYTIEKRALLKLNTKNHLFGEVNYALNDVAISKKNGTSLIHIHVFVDDILLNSYWADGIIIATPTGSTAYSLSCNGPIIVPYSENFVITPIASHNLNVRPVVIPDNSIIRVKVDGRNNNFNVSLDSHVESFNESVELIIKKAGFKFNLIKLNDKNFYDTIREKLMWGLDIRN